MVMIMGYILFGVQLFIFIYLWCRWQWYIRYNIQSLCNDTKLLSKFFLQIRTSSYCISSSLTDITDGAIFPGNSSSVEW